MQFDVSSRTILCVRHGSHAYGLATPLSDEDFKGVCIAPKRYHLGYGFRFEQQELLVHKGHPHDKVTYALQKFVNLAADTNPNIIEVLFGDEADIVQIDAFGRELLGHRDLFITKKARWTFSGYAISQVKRIERHRKWLLSPPKALPTRAELGLPERTVIPADQLAAAHSAVEKKLEQWQFNEVVSWDLTTRVMVQRLIEEMIAEMSLNTDSKYVAAARSIGYDDNFILLLDKERQYKSRKNEWDQYQNWLKTRNPKRAEGEAKFGYDLKHGSHCLRLMRMCKEILSGQGVIVKRPDADELLAIKLHGAMSYDDLMTEAKRLEAECQVLYETSTLPHHADKLKIDDIVVDMVERYLAEHG